MAIGPTVRRGKLVRPRVQRNRHPGSRVHHQLCSDHRVHKRHQQRHLHIQPPHLYNLALQGRAPRLFTKVSRCKVPYAAILTVCAGYLLGVILTVVLPEQVFELCSAVVVFMVVLGWVSELLSEPRFRSMRRREGTEEQLVYKMPWWPYSSIFALGFMALLLIMMAVIPTYRVTYLVTIPWMILLFVIYRITEKRRNKTLARDAGISTAGTTIERAAARRWHENHAGTETVADTRGENGEYASSMMRKSSNASPMRGRCPPHMRASDEREKRSIQWH